jgi:hypothetical protein
MAIPARTHPFLTGLAVFAVLMVSSILVHYGVGQTDGASFNVLCHLDHVSSDDPIVYPNVPQASHAHLFFGNSSTNASSTTPSLQAAGSTCSRGLGSLDHSSYWVPALYETPLSGQSRLINSKKISLAVYFQRAGGASGPRVQPIPTGLRMIAGNPAAMVPQSTHLVWWSCGNLNLPGIPHCPNQQITATVMFPNCWDGKHLDSPDHRTHMAYPGPNGACPSSHPVSLPRTTYNVTYPRLQIGSDYSLSSGSQYSFHGDFINAWNPTAQSALVASCLNSPHDCNDMYKTGNILTRPDQDSPPIHLNQFK